MKKNMYIGEILPYLYKAGPCQKPGHEGNRVVRSFPVIWCLNRSDDQMP